MGHIFDAYFTNFDAVHQKSLHDTLRARSRTETEVTSKYVIQLSSKNTDVLFSTTKYFKCWFILVLNYIGIL